MVDRHAYGEICQETIAKIHARICYVLQSAFTLNRQTQESKSKTIRRGTGVVQMRCWFSTRKRALTQPSGLCLAVTDSLSRGVAAKRVCPALMIYRRES